MGKNTNLRSLNKDLHPIQELLGGADKTVVYRPELNALTGSINGSLILNQIIYYWFRKDRDSFNKFLQPSSSPAYREGDSWLEELGMTKDQFYGATSDWMEGVKKAEIEEELKTGDALVYYHRSNYGNVYFLNERIALHEIRKSLGLIDEDSDPPEPDFGKDEVKEEDNETDLGNSEVEDSEGTNPPLRKSRSRLYISKRFTKSNSKNPSFRFPDESEKWDKNIWTRPEKEGRDIVFDLMEARGGYRPRENDYHFEMIDPIIEKYSLKELKTAINNHFDFPESDMDHPEAKGKISTIFKSETAFENWLGEAEEQHYQPPETEYPDNDLPDFDIDQTPENRIADIENNIRFLKESGLDSAEDTIRELEQERQQLLEQIESDPSP